MKKIKLTFPHVRREKQNLFLKMNLTLLTLLVCIMQVSASVYSQTTKLTLNLQDKKISDVLMEIEETSDFRFFYQREQVDVERKVDLKANNKSVDEILKTLFADQGISFRVMDDNLILLTASDFQSQQEQTVRGKVTNARGESIPGATVIIKGTSKGGITDSNGEYILANVPGDAVLVFSFVGMQTQEVEVNGRSSISVTLGEDVIGLEEVVAIGYGTQRKSDVTGSVGVVDAADILERPSFNALQGMKGKVAGVNIFSNSGSPTGSTRVIIRGVNSITTSTNPLYVVDGVVMEDFHLVNPNDIERIEVLKDASSAAIYGARGANGVILVTTRRGAKTGEMVVGYDGYVSVGKIRKKMDVMNSEEWLEVIKRGYENAPKYRDYDPGEEPTIDFTDPRLFDSNGKPLYDTDWQEEATRTAVSHNHQLSIQQGNEKSSVGAFLNYTETQGIMLSSWMKRVNAKIAYDAKPTDWMDFGINMLINKTWENEVE
jgi:TonB-dependent starch-binding outer membrane protein SusC